MKLIFLGCGYLGYNLSKQLENLFDVEIWGIPSAYSSLCTNFKEVDVFSKERLADMDAKDAIIVDTLGIISSNHVPKDETLELEAFENKYSSLLDALIEMGIKQYVFLSSGGTIYGDHLEPVNEEEKIQPTSFYAKSKARIEKLIQGKGIDYLILRLSNPYGGFQEAHKQQGVIPILIRAALSQDPFNLLVSPQTVRDYCYIDDVSLALKKLLENDVHSEIINVGSGIPTTLQEVMDLVEIDTHQKINIVEKENPVPYVNAIVLDITKLKELTRFEIKTSIQEGIHLEVQRIMEEDA